MKLKARILSRSNFVFELDGKDRELSVVQAADAMVEAAEYTLEETA
jgi:hypothetical protein